MAALDRISIAAIGDTTADLAEQASAAEAAGIDCVWTPELFRSSVTQAAWLAAKTEKVGVGTGIAWAFTRSAVHPRGHRARHRRDVGRALPAGARRGGEAAQRDLALGRLRQARPAPARDDRGDSPDHGEGLRGGEPIRYEGEYHGNDIKGWVRPDKPVRDRVPIYAAAMREGTCRMAGASPTG